MAVEGLTGARTRQLDDLLFLAHQTASLVAYAYHKPKKLPKLDALRGSTEKPAAQPQTADEQIAVFQSILSNRMR